MTAEAVRRRFTVDEYERMAADLILTWEDRVELIDGEIVEMSPIGSRHSAAVARLTHLFTRWFDDRAIVRVQSPMRLSVDSEPEPDLVVARPRRDFYELSHPVPDDVLLLVEVAETSGAFDRKVKLPLYAKARIPEVWIVDVLQGWVEVHRAAEADAYADVRRLERGDRLTCEAFDDLAVDVTDVLG
jgi:Uma2 family endonuclease